MAFAPIEMNGVLSRSQDMTQLKQNLDNKVIIDQSNIQQEIAKDVTNKMHQVRTAEDTGESEDEFDARREGKNKYSSSSGKKKAKKEDRVIVKSRGGFDMKI